MILIEYGTPVLVDLYGRKVRGRVAQCRQSFSNQAREAIYYVQTGFEYEDYGGDALEERGLIVVPESFIKRIDGKPNPHYRNAEKEVYLAPCSKAPLNDFQMRLAFNGGIYPGAEIVVDGEVINSDYAINYPNLIKSISKNGKFYILTCGCGDAGCAGIHERIEVSHSRPVITWQITDPCPERVFHFNENQYFSSIVQFFRAASAVKEVTSHEHDEINIGPYGFDGIDFESCLRELDLLMGDPRFHMEIQPRIFG